MSLLKGRMLWEQRWSIFLDVLVLSMEFLHDNETREVKRVLITLQQSSYCRHVSDLDTAFRQDLGTAYPLFGSLSQTTEPS